MGEFYEWYSEENTCTHLAGGPNSCMCLMICGASVFTACTSSDDNPATPDLSVSEKIIGKWVFYERNGELTPTNKKRVFNFVSTTKAYVSASHNSAAATASRKSMV